MHFRTANKIVFPRGLGQYDRENVSKPRVVSIFAPGGTMPALAHRGAPTLLGSAMFTVSDWIALPHTLTRSEATDYAAEALNAFRSLVAGEEFSD